MFAVYKRVCVDNKLARGKLPKSASQPSARTLRPQYPRPNMS
jgi:hypothetical protein